MDRIQVGVIFPTNNGGDVMVIEYVNSKKILVEFLDIYRFRKEVEATKLRNGTIRNPYAISVQGVGCLGEGPYKTKVGGIKVREYPIWAQILKRATDPEYKRLNETYKEVTIVEDWLIFQNFAEWYNKNYVEGWYVDKDLLSKDSKIYGPETCCFLPPVLSTYIVTQKRGEHLLGVHKNRDNHFYYQISKGGKKISVSGGFKTEQEAHEAYLRDKEEYLEHILYEYKDLLDPRALEALKNWEIK